MKLADGQLQRMPRRAVMLSYEFDGCSSLDEFLVIDMSLSFKCIHGIPWVIRYQPVIYWLTRSVKRRRGYDVSAVFAHLESASIAWPHVAVVDSMFTIQATPQASDGPRCVVCERAARPVNAVEQRLPHRANAIELVLPRHETACDAVSSSTSSMPAGSSPDDGVSSATSRSSPRPRKR